MKRIIATLLISLLFISCNKVKEPESPDLLFEKYKSSVVLIASQYYYEVASGDFVFYYSPGSTDKIYYTEEDVLNNLSFSTGTGFIISEEGEIITNNHVVNNKDENYKIELATFCETAKGKIENKVYELNSEMENIKYSYNYSYDLSYSEKTDLENKYEDYSSKKNLLVQAYNLFDNIDISNSTSKLIINKLGIAFNDTHVTEIDDLQECVVIKTSEDENVDLALIQTKSKTFNNKPKNILNFNDNNPNIELNPDEFKERDINKPIKINDDVFMIGYNKGFSLASTKQGIKSQFTSGKISQENDGERILYTIPTLEGSSGSPIIDKWGNLIGVNFAKVTNSQSFSFGIPVAIVKKFYNE